MTVSKIICNELMGSDDEKEEVNERSQDPYIFRSTQGMHGYIIFLMDMKRDVIIYLESTQIFSYVYVMF